MRTDEAIDAWREVLELDPADFRALAALETLFTQEARWEECVDVLERRAEALAEPEDQVDVLMQVGRTSGPTRSAMVARPPRSTSACWPLDPGNLTASTELEQLYRQRKSWVKLIDLLLPRTEFVSDAPERINLLGPGRRDLRAAAR